MAEHCPDPACSGKVKLNGGTARLSPELTRRYGTCGTCGAGVRYLTTGEIVEPGVTLGGAEARDKAVSGVQPGC